MLDLVPDEVPGSPRILADVGDLAFRTAGIAAAFCSKVHVHLPRAEVPLALAELHRVLSPDAPVAMHLFGGDRSFAPLPGDEFEGRRFSQWTERGLRDVLHGAGFSIEWHEAVSFGSGGRSHLIGARRVRTLPDTVGPGMRLLMCGLNPSLHAADAGVGFHTANNRFWAAGQTAGIISTDRDPRRTLRVDRVGMTDLVKRATPRASALAASEYREGFDRLERLCDWLQPGAVCFVGLAGWRAAVDRRATAGLQPTSVGGRPAYVMPSTSGLNAATKLDTLVEHLAAAATLADRSST